MIHPTCLMEDAKQELELLKLQGKPPRFVTSIVRDMMDAEGTQSRLVRDWQVPSGLSEPEAVAVLREEYPQLMEGYECD